MSHSNYSGPHQVHKKRPDGYWHGAVIFGDSAQARNDLDSAGWFPGVHLTKASSSLVAKFQQSIGGAAGADALEVPKEWAKQALYAKSCAAMVKEPPVKVTDKVITAMKVADRVLPIDDDVT